MKYLFLLLISVPTFAQFSGKFSGQGTAIFHTGKRYECSEIFLKLATSPKLFTLHQGGYNCGFLKASFDPFSFSIKNGKLFYGNLEMGGISDKELTYHYFDPEDGSTYYLTLTNDNGQIHYSEEWYDGEKTALTVKGDLKLVEFELSAVK